MLMTKKNMNYTINDSLNDFQNSAETCRYEQILKLNIFNFNLMIQIKNKVTCILIDYYRYINDNPEENNDQKIPYTSCNEMIYSVHAM